MDNRGGSWCGVKPARAALCREMGVGRETHSISLSIRPYKRWLASNTSRRRNGNANATIRTETQQQPPLH
jgi:hypothetical protein